MDKQEIELTKDGEYTRCDACGRGFRDFGQNKCPHCHVSLHEKRDPRMLVVDMADDGRE